MRYVKYCRRCCLAAFLTWSAPVQAQDVSPRQLAYVHAEIGISPLLLLGYPDVGASAAFIVNRFVSLRLSTFSSSVQRKMGLATIEHVDALTVELYPFAFGAAARFLDFIYYDFFFALGPARATEDVRLYGSWYTGKPSGGTDDSIETSSTGRYGEFGWRH